MGESQILEDGASLNDFQYTKVLKVVGEERLSFKEIDRALFSVKRQPPTERIHSFAFL